MHHKKLIVGTILSIGLGVLGGLGFQSLSNETSSASAGVNSLTVTSNGMTEPLTALKSVSFKDKVKMPENIPFKSNSSNKITSTEETSSDLVEFGEVSKMLENELYHHYYIDKKSEGFIEVQVTDGNVQPQYDAASGYKIKETKMANGITASYMDNTIYQFLYWQQDGLSYTLVGEKTKNDKTKKYTSNELVEIAESFQ